MLACDAYLIPINNCLLILLAQRRFILRRHLPGLDDLDDCFPKLEIRISILLCQDLGKIDLPLHLLPPVTLQAIFLQDRTHLIFEAHERGRKHKRHQEKSHETILPQNSPPSLRKLYSPQPCPGFRNLSARSKFLPITNLGLTYSFCNSDPAGSHLKKDQGGAGWRQLGRGSLGVDPDRAGGRGAKGLPLAFDLAGGQEFAFVEWSLDQLPDTQNSISEAR